MQENIILHRIRGRNELTFYKSLFVSEIEDETKESTKVEYSGSITVSEESNVDGGNECKKRKRE